MTTTLRAAAACACALAGLAAVIGIASGIGGSRAEDSPKARSAELSVSVQPVRSMCFRDRIEVTGTLAARETVEVVPEQEGFKVAEILVEPLDTVASGQVLVRLARIDDPGNPASGMPIRAPVAGLIVRSGAVAGMPVSPRQGPLFRIATGGEIELQANVPLPELGKLAAGQAVTVKPLGLAELAGKVRRIEQGTDAATQLGRVRIGLGSGHDVRIGTFARGVVELGESCGLSVPYSAVTYEPEGTIVHVVNGDRIEARQVMVGLLSGDSAEIRLGLNESDLVVVRAGAFVREGDRVNPIRVKDSPAKP